MAAKVDIYTKFGCGYCFRAKSLLEQLRNRAPNASTVPQIFIGDTHVGGSDELAALDREGKLDEMLAG